MATVVEAAREALGPVGVCLPGSLTVALNAERQRDAMRRFDHAGYRTVWTNEVLDRKSVV
jgi:hypothetical protein